MNSTQKALWILNRLGEQPYEIGLTDIAKEIGFSKSGIYKTLVILETENFIAQDKATKKYHLGPVLLRLGSTYTEQKGIWDIAFPIMKTIAETTRETIYIGIREGNDAILAYKIESPRIVRMFRRIGLKFPRNAGAIGKLLSAYHDPRIIEAILGSEKLEKTTPKAIVDPQKLLEDYKNIREKGYAISDEENKIGNYGIAAPIFDQNGKVWCCLCLAGPKEDFVKNNIETWIQLVINGALEISYKLGY